MNGISDNVDMDYCYTDYPAIIKNGGYNGYKKPATPEKKTVAQLAKEVIEGKWGNGEERQQKLTDAGYDYDKVQSRVNELMKKQ